MFLFAAFLFHAKFPTVNVKVLIIANVAAIVVLLIQRWALQHAVMWSLLFWLLYYVAQKHGADFSARIYICLFGVLIASHVWELPILFGIGIAPQYTHEAISMLVNMAYPLLISSKLIAIPFLILQFRRIGWHYNRTTAIVLGVYLAWSLALFSYNAITLSGIKYWVIVFGVGIDIEHYFVRLPTVLFFPALLSKGLRSQLENSSISLKSDKASEWFC